MAEGKIKTGVRNFKMGIATIVTCYTAFIFYLFVLFLSIEIFGKENMFYSFIMAGLLAAFVLAAGILFLVSLVKNIIQSRASNKISIGLILTIAGFPPIALCCLAFILKALSEGH